MLVIHRQYVERLTYLELLNVIKATPRVGHSDIIGIVNMAASVRTEFTNPHFSTIEGAYFETPKCQLRNPHGSSQ